MKYSRKLFRFNSSKARKRLEEQGYPMLDHYNGRLVYKAHQWQAEHVYTLKQAWENGFRKQYLVNPKSALINMKSFANDPDNLISVSGSSNMSRGSLSIWEFLPLNLAYVPVRNEIVRTMNDRYGLELTLMQEWAMKFTDKKILVKYKYGIRLGKVRAWLISNGFYKPLIPF